MGKIDFWGGDKGGAAAFAGPPPRHADEALLLMRSFEESRQGWFWSTDAAGRVRYLSRSIAEMLGAGRKAGAAAPFADLFVPAEEGTDVRRRLPFILAKHSPFEKVVVRAAAASDAELYWALSGTPVFDAEGRFAGFRGTALDVTEQLKSSRDAALLARYDPLTGLPNRLSMAASLEDAVSGNAGRPCTILLVDLDRFKQVNDTLGHPAGDALLKQVAERLLRIVGDRESVFRLGGDEFQVILPALDHRGIIGDTAGQIIASLSQPYSIGGHRCIIGASVGIAISPADGISAEELIRNADLALYASKAGGRGRFRFFSHELLAAAEDRRRLEEDLRDAIAKDQIFVEYQPVVESRTNLVKGVEALVRWRHPERGRIPPSLFIPIAEEVGLIPVLGEWVLRQACREVAGWPATIRVAVNVSPLQFANEAFPEIVRDALAESGLKADRLELEITEGVFLADSAETDTVFARLKEIGLRLALDDFGTGYSSLSYLRTAPFDKIKIDQTFVRAATLPGSRNGAIISAIVALAEALGMETTAEGIEFMDQLQLIRDLGVSHVQGYVYSKPIGAEDVRRRIEAGDWMIEPAGPARQRSERQAIFRKVGIMHGSRYEPAVIRNLSDSGALVQGLTHAGQGDLCIVDFGDGQLVFARVTRSAGRNKGIAFEQPLVDDGKGGLITAQRISPYLLATLGVPNFEKSAEASEVSSELLPVEMLGARLGLQLMAAQDPADGGTDPIAAAATPLRPAASRGLDRDVCLTDDEAARLVEASMTSHNRQLKYIVSLLMLCGARPGELLRARWQDMDLDAGLWRIGGRGNARTLQLSPLSISLLRRLPRWDKCEHVIANPATRKPYRSLTRSWEAVREKAGLPYLELDDLRFCHVDFASHTLESLSSTEEGPEEEGDALQGSVAPAAAALDGAEPGSAPEQAESA